MTEVNSWGQQPEQRSKPWATGIVTAIGVAALTVMIAFLCLLLVIGSIDEASVLENNLRFGCVLWAVLVIVAVFAVFYLAARFTPTGSVRFWLGVAGVGYLLNLYSWGGTAIGVRNVLWMGELGSIPSLGITVLGWIVDLAVWLGVAMAGITLGHRQRRVRSRPETFHKIPS